MIIRKSTALLTSLICVSLLASCSRGTVTTVDKSVEYQSAQSIPSLVKEPTPEAIAASQSIVESVTPENVTASIVANKKGVKRLLVEAKLDDAWNYLDYALEKADVTVYNRNKEAGIFSVGCGDVIEPFDPPKKGWSLFKRKKRIRETEYCVLKAEGARRKTNVSLLNRKGDPMDENYATELYQRILNN